MAEDHETFYQFYLVSVLEVSVVSQEVSSEFLLEELVLLQSFWAEQRFKISEF